MQKPNCGYWYMDGQWRKVDNRRILRHAETKLWILFHGWKMEKGSY